ncbi:MAG: hypothetical protein IJC15_00565 [Clostridia bacterium]|nr:hypothetical protein [Clostridia bacterium]
MNLQDITWHRLFSQSFYKNKQIPLGEMSFVRDFVADTRGDLHPLIRKSDDCCESVQDNAYHLSAGSVQRLLGQYFPYASYAITFRAVHGRCGFAFHIPGAQASVICHTDRVTFIADDREEALALPDTADTRTLIVSCRRQYFDLYFLSNGTTRFFHTFCAESFAQCAEQKVFQRGFAAVCAAGCVDIHAASFYIDCGVGQADLRPVHYENGDVLYENGRIYLTASIRMQENAFQGIFSWVPGTAQFELTGALFFDCGDGIWRNYLASSLLFDRRARQWYIWVSAFENQVRLAHGAFAGDPRFGINVVDVTVMDKADDTDGYQDFVGFKGDEDPDFYYNEEENKWYMAICRLDPTIRAYRYAFFTSNDPFTGYRYVGSGCDGAETGGSFVTIEGERLFVCGNDFKRRANYRIYSKDGMTDAVFDFDDGGFRGWGSIIPLKLGSRTRYFWITFDRHKGSDYTWSYGNLYCFEGVFSR